ncbi:ATP-binding protein [Paenibacillus cellulositrophicus]|uniref:ATP-binding protein n=1 Tax=Paenibacillus cellulositrophicus TaxID=562959 RepID=UPI0012671B2A|nr:ATP-binding protein [Paenibacillus cellulositrophicus]
MIVKQTRHVLIPSLTTFIMLSSILLGKADSIFLLFLSGAMLTGVMIFFAESSSRSLLLQSVSLAFFHWSSQLNWTQIIYFILIIMETRNTRNLKYTLSLAFTYSMLYTVIRLSYLPWDRYNLLVSVYDLISLVLIVLGMRYLVTTEIERKRLLRRNQFLASHDPLTGFLNYDGYVSAVNELVETKKSPFVLILLDFQDFKSLNKESIRGGNEILTRISLIIRTYFPSAFAISRYAGDRFAMVIPDTDGSLGQAQDILESGKLGYEVTYSTARFPRESTTSHDIIMLAEDRLFQKKRMLWLKREEEMFRSEKLKIVGELAAGMAHEIRNPLTTLKGFIHLSKSQSYNIGPWVDIITNEITRMNELTAEFLQFSKPHLGNIRPEPISHCVERARNLTESQVTSRGHSISMENVSDSVMVEMERDKIVQVLINLVRNAIEAMEQPGHIHIQVQQTNSMVTIDVSDTGKGIPEDLLPKIFDPFYTTKEEGTGLGLSICHKIIQDHNGTLTVKSMESEGSVFTITLPVLTEEA